MADKRISELNTITGANTADDDLFVIVDSSAGETKKITRSELGNAFDSLDVSGTVTADGLTVDSDSDGGATIQGGSSRGLVVHRNDGTGSQSAGIQIKNNDREWTFFANDDFLSVFDDTANKTHFKVETGGDISFYDTSGNPAFFWDASAESLGIGTTSPTYALDVESDNSGGLVAEFVNTANSIPQGVLIDFPNATPNATNRFFLKMEDSTSVKAEINTTGGGYFMGNVGIGTTNPIADLSIVDNSTGSGIEIQPEVTTDTNRITNFDRVESAYKKFRLDASEQQFYISGTPAATIDSSGVLKHNLEKDFIQSATEFNFASGFNFTGGSQEVWINYRGATSGIGEYRFYNGLAGSGSYIPLKASAFTVSSDYRLKENIVEMTGSTERVKQLNPCQFNFKSDVDLQKEITQKDKNKTVDGFLAHEVADVVPEAVTGTKDAMQTEEYEVTPAVLDDDGNVVTEAVMGTREVPVYQGIDQSKLVPLLTGALQEAIARIETLETQVATLQGN